MVFSLDRLVPLDLNGGAWDFGAGVREARFVQAILRFGIRDRQGEIHASLRVTPAMEAGRTNRVWSIEELVGLLEA